MYNDEQNLIQLFLVACACRASRASRSLSWELPFSVSFLQLNNHFLSDGAE
jgi:hypothetical protein